MTLFTVACAALAFVAPVIQTSSPSTSVDAVKRRLVGTWKLVKYEILDERGAARRGRVVRGERRSAEQRPAERASTDDLTVSEPHRDGP